MEQSDFLKIKPIFFCLKFAGLVPFYLDEYNNIIYSTSHIKLCGILQACAAIISVNLSITVDMNKEIGVAQILAYALSIITFFKLMAQGIRRIFFGNQTYEMWIEVKKCMEFCQIHDIRYDNSKLVRKTITITVLAILAHFSFGYYNYLIGTLTFNNFILLICVYIMDSSYLFSAIEYIFLTWLMRGYFEALNKVLKQHIAKSSVFTAEDVAKELKKILRCYTRLCETMDTICRNFALPAIFTIGQIILLLLIHCHNIILKHTNRFDSTIWIFNFDLSWGWVNECLILLGHICVSSYVCRLAVSAFFFCFLNNS